MRLLTALETGGQTLPCQEAAVQLAQPLHTRTQPSPTGQGPRCGNRLCPVPREENLMSFPFPLLSVLAIVLTKLFGNWLGLWSWPSQRENVS